MDILASTKAKNVNQKCGRQSKIQVLIEQKGCVRCCAAFAMAVYSLAGEGCSFFPDQRKM